MKRVLLLGLFLFGCQDVSEYKRLEHRVTIIPSNMSIDKAEEAVWRVGPLRRQRVSKGVRIKLNLPQLEKNDLKDLVSSLGIDSWLIRAKRRTLITNETLDYFYVPLIVPGTGKSDFRIKQIAAGFINLYYSAAALSTRFEKFPCPAFNHSKQITEFSVEDFPSSDRSIQGNRLNPSLFSGKLTPYTYNPFPINAGKEMNGEYYFEIALFSAKDKFRKSSWFTLSQSVKVTKEKNVKITGCKDFKIPENNSKINDVRDFKFGR